MKDATAFRGQPLLVFAGVLSAWLGLRVALWQAPFEPDATPALHAVATGSRDSPSVSAGRRSGVRSLASPIQFVSFNPVRPNSMATLPARAVMSMASIPLPPRTTAALPAVPFVPSGSQSVPVRRAVGHNLLLTAGMSQMELPSLLAAYARGPARIPAGVPAGAQFVVALPQRIPRFAGLRLGADAWLMVRQDTTSSVISGRPSYGRSQAGGVVRYRLAPSSPHGPQAYVRASSALQGPLEKDLAAGVSARPIPRMPLRLAAELRLSETSAGTELRPAVIAVTELPPLALAHGIQAEAYVQGGYVAGRFATAFVDGQGRVERPVARLGQAGVAAGGGVWGGAQKGAARLDLGPTAAVTFALGRARGRVSVDYRFRIAGDAEPRSGPALTLSAGF